MEIETKNEIETKPTDFKNLDSGLEILVQLSEEGQIDPWDVDLIDVTNKYLAALNSTPRENLLNAGRAIFYASVLLRLKSEILLNISSETLSASQQTEDFFPEDQFLEDDSVHIDLSKLETFINRSSQGRHQRKRKILLTDLIFALQQAKEEEEKRALRAKIRAERTIHRIIAPDIPDDVLDMAHEEDIDDIVVRIESVIEEHLTDDKPITFSYLSSVLNDKVKPFLAVLFMTHSKKIVIEQSTIYGEINIYKAGKITREMEEQAEAIKQAEIEEKENALKAKKKKSTLGKVKEKIKNIAEKVRNKITGDEGKIEEEVIIEEKEVN